MAFLRRGKERAETAAPDDWRAALVAALEGLDRAHVEHLARFVMTGEDPAVLTRPPSNPYWVPQLLGSPQQRAGRDEVAARVVAGCVAAGPAALQRWGRVLQTSSGAMGGHRWGFTMGPVAGLDWPELVLRHAHGATPATSPLGLSLDDLAHALALDGATPPDLLVAALEVTDYARYADHDVRAALARMPGFAPLVDEHRDLVAPAASGGAADRRTQALGLLAALDDDALARWADVVALGVAANARDVRRAAGPLLDRLDRLDPGVADAALRAVATGGRPDERGRALGVLHERADDDATRQWVVDTATADRAGSVRGLVEAWRAAAVAPQPDDLVVPALGEVDWAVPREVARAAAAAIHRDLVERITISNQHLAQRLAHNPALRGHRTTQPQRVPDRTLVTTLVDLLTSPEPVQGPVPDPDGLMAYRHVARERASRMEPAAAVQLLRACGVLTDDASHTYELVETVEALHRETGAPDLATLQQLLDGVGVDGYRTVWAAYAQRWQSLGRDWPADDVWPFLARNLEAVLKESEPRAHDWSTDPAAFFAALATFPVLPARVVDHLYAVALGTHRSTRPLAQDALARDPGRATRAAAALGDGRGEVRVVAAQWLARIADPAALPALQAAWTKERNDVVRGALLDALEALGQPVADYLDVDATAARADQLLARGLPASLAWLSWDAVPEVRWADSGDPVPRAVVQWLAATAVKARSPEPDALLRRYADLVEPADRARLGHHLLAAWLAEDTRPIPVAEAEQQASQLAAAYQQWYAHDPQSPYHGRSVAEIAATLLPGLAQQPAGSAIASKGLLAVVAATAGREVVAPVERYLKQWYGQRAAQGKALIAMLAWVDDPSATQLVLSVGSRFRTKSFQQEATRQAEALAERKGWTLDELADRTIPTAGFDADGVLELSYGPRAFTARLRPDLTVVLQDADAKELKSLPAPRQSDDADLVKDAKKAFTAAKKDVKAIAAQQAQRLYEALCTARDWPADDWRRYLVDHPVVGPATRRLVWVDTDTGASFRPLDDGTLTDLDDGEVVLDAGHRVRLAHDSLLPADVSRRWLEHLADYEVDPLFQQLGKGTYDLPDHRRHEREVRDLEGHLLSAYSLRGRALKAGYTRGQTEDAGWFYAYRKRFPSLGLVAQIGFTGNYLPEENRTVALTALSFHRELEQGRESDVTLGDVPAVLLSEAVGDLRHLAAGGTGYDPDWSTKTEFR
ncbi:DUF4132 domain-containing protein [Nocardioides rubriscoriae]|uniref:DUF4132 domain-containing protein n=1 Tax=Nocardioides rubriscoriae TaxID=642762 RepID=UPI0011DF30AA|nr:DUF4132 domain-containing protein [Nocardioides rubriscoriae]